MYNVFNCNAKQLKELLSLGYQTGTPIYIAGPPGIGKSEIVHQFAKSIGAKMPKPFIVSGYQPEDIFGIPVPNKESGRLDYYQTKFFPPTDSDEKWVLFFDELSNADKRLQAPLQQFFLFGEAGDYQIPKNCYLVAAGNTVEDECYAYEMSRALEDRFCITYLRVAIDPWVDWALEAKIHPDIISFLKVKPEYLHYTLMQEKHVGSQEDRVLPTPRAWGKFVDRFLKQEGYSRTIQEIAISGVVGTQIASMFFRVVDELKELPSPKDIIEAGRSTRKDKYKGLVPNNAVGLWSVCFGLLSYCQTFEHYEGLVKYLEHLSSLTDTNLPIREVVCLTMERALNNSRKIANLDLIAINNLFKSLAKQWYDHLGTVLREMQA